jgi:DNA-binding transcriptional regulator YiaG
MPTQNRRVAAYLPKEIDDRLKTFISERNLKGDSPALIAILSEYFGVSYLGTQKVDYSSFVSQEQFQELSIKVAELFAITANTSKGSDQKFEDNVLVERIQHLENRLSKLESVTDKEITLSNGELAKRLGIDGSTLSHWKSTGKKGKSPDELLKATREKDPDGIGWSVVPETGKFRPERELPSGSLDVLQGDLLSNPTSELSSSS